MSQVWDMQVVLYQQMIGTVGVGEVLRNNVIKVV